MVTVTRTPLSAEQAGIWFTEQLGRAGASVSLLALTVEFDGELDIEAMRRASPRPSPAIPSWAARWR